MGNARHILIAGAGVSGQAAAKLAAQEGHSVTVIDSRCNDELRKQKDILEKDSNISVCLGYPPQEISKFEPDICVLSPGIPPRSEIAQYAHALQCPVIGELEFGFSHCLCPVLAVTGTNGKTTTVEMITHALRYAGKKAQSAGNIGTPLSEAAPYSSSLDWLVVETSSFQLARIKTFRPDIAVLLNLTSDHMDWHEHQDAYFAAKCRIFLNVDRADQVVLREDLLKLPCIQKHLPQEGGEPLLYNRKKTESTHVYIDGAQIKCHTDQAASALELLPVTALPTWADYHTENALAAVAACSAAGIPPGIAAESLPTFNPAPHRLEEAAFVNGVTYINDSKATNPAAMTQGVQAVKKKYNSSVFLIAGGLDKGLEFDDITVIIRDNVKKSFLIGESQEKMLAAWGNSVECETCGTLQDAVEAAAMSAQSGDVVLLSPGCASQDMFADYKERAKVFYNAINKEVT